MTKSHPHLAVVFPGQGSQHVGMMRELLETHAVVKNTIDEASAALNYDMAALMLEDSAGQLNQTEYTQPALLAASVAVWRLWQTQCAITPAIMAGHSLGEYSALVCSDSVDFADALQLVAERGRLMQAAVPEGTGAMAAIVGLEPEQVTIACQEAAQNAVIAPANFNAIGQIVISGERAAVERAVAISSAMGAKMAKLLPVSVPSHCELMRPAAVKLAEKLEQISFHAPKYQVLHNVDVKPHAQSAAIRQVLAEQLYQPVRWVETMQHCANAGITTVIEMGPNKVLAGLNKRIDSRLQTLSVFDSATLEAAVKHLQTTEG